MLITSDHSPKDPINLTQGYISNTLLRLALCVSDILLDLMYTLTKIIKWRRIIGRLAFALFVVTAAFWISTKKPSRVVFVEQPTLHDEIKPVPRGQTYFHSYPESNRYTSDDTWRPHEFYKDMQIFTSKKQHTNSHFHQDLPQENIPGADKILLLVKTSMHSIWKQMPVHLFTTLTQFPNVVLYSDGPDSIGGIEVVDIISRIDKQQLRNSAQLLYYRIHRSLRDKHVYIAPDQVHVMGAEHIDKFKNLHMLLHAYWQQSVRDSEFEDIQLVPGMSEPAMSSTSQEFDWYVVVDDSSFLFAHSLFSYLQRLDPSLPYYLGSNAADPTNKDKNAESGLILSRKTMEIAFGGSDALDLIDEYTRLAEQETRGDHVLTRYLRDNFQIELDSSTSQHHFQANPVWKVQFSATNWCREVYSFAQQSPRDIELMWEYQRVKPHKLLYVDLYLDFAKPYFPSNAQKNWDNGANTVEFVPETHYDSNAPYASYRNCELACRNDPRCMMFRHDSYKHYCGLGIHTISLGRPQIKYSDEPSAAQCQAFGIRCQSRAHGEEVTSGWFLPHIQQMRRAMLCDPLFEDQFSEGAEGNALDQAEGWWLRAKERYGSGTKDPLV